jgi:hypothetical protein
MIILNKSDILKQKGKSKANPHCRFCNLKTVFEDPIENEIIFACKCKKNPRKRCHVGCLGDHMNRHVNIIKRKNSVTYQWKDVKCPDCNYDYPKQIRMGQEIIDMIDIKRPKFPCLVLEKTSKREKNRVYTHEIVILRAKKHEPLVLGHGPNSDLRMADISTSVNHAQINFVDNRFLIFDNNSRFGTLLELRKPFRIENNGVVLQVENKVFHFYTEGENLVRTIKKRKFKRFEMTLNKTQKTVMMNLATRMKAFPVSSISQISTFKK